MTINTENGEKLLEPLTPAWYTDIFVTEFSRLLHEKANKHKSQKETLMIIKVKGGFKATTSSGRPLSRKPKTKSAARKQLAAVEINKSRRK